MFGFLYKEIDATPSILEMAARCMTGRGLGHPEAISSRIAGFECPAEDSRRWFAPVVSAWEAAEGALRRLGLIGEVLPPETCVSGAQLSAACATFLRSAPVVCGPVDRTVLWGRSETRYWAGAAHFVMLGRGGPPGAILTADPEGGPAMPRRVEQLWRALKAAGGGLMQLRPGPALAPDEIVAIAHARLRQAQALAGSRHAGSAGVLAFAESLSETVLSGSRRAALELALPHRQRAAARLLALLQCAGRPCPGADHPEFLRGSAWALRALNEGNLPLLRQALGRMAVAEATLAETLESGA